MRERKRGCEGEGTQADPLVSEICLLMFGLGKWKLLWCVCQSVLSHSRWRHGRRRGDTCAYGREGVEGE